MAAFSPVFLQRGIIPFMGLPRDGMQVKYVLVLNVA